ncbi:MAG TPA: IS1634 family transposase [Gammaproteobacteria bacterium]|nr:IS1634 family transposase [Gammaproteobacteria bacterium]
MPDQPTYHSQVLDHLGLVAGMFDELGMGEIIDQVTQQNPEMRDLTGGEAVNAMVLNGLGCINQALYLVPRFFHNKPTYQLISPRVTPQQLNDDALGRALDTLYAYGVTELYSLLAAPAAERLGLAPRLVHLDTTSFHVDGRYNSDEAPEEQVVHITQGYSRDHRPDLNQVRLELLVEHQAGIPLLMQPLSGNSSDTQEFGEAVRLHVHQLQAPYGPTYLVADSALYSEANLEKLAQTQMKWITRVPATLREAQAVLAQADPQAMVALQEGYRADELTSTYGGVEQRWVLIYSEPRRAQVQRTVDKQLRRQSDQAVKALKKLGGVTLACEADARQALATFAQDLQATVLAPSTVRATPRYGKRGRPGPGVQPDQMVYQIEGTLASSRASRQALIDQHSCFMLATNELDATQLPPQQLLEGDKGQTHVERGFRFLKNPEFLASSLYLKKPERIMALLMVMTVCLLVYAALEYRIRQALQGHDATFPNQSGKRVQNPTARWVLHSFVGVHLLIAPGQWPIVLNLTDEHRNLLQLLGKPYMACYGVKYS